MPVRILRTMLSVVAALAYITVGTIVVASLLDHCDVLPADSVLYGIDFVPPFWFLPPVALAVLLTLASRRVRAAVVLAGLYAVLLASFGDIAIPVFGGSALPDSLSQKFTVAALNVRYYSFGLDRVLDEVKRTNADLTLLSENVLTDDERAHVEERVAPAFFRKDHQDGTALISRYPIVSYAEISLPSREASLSGGNDVDSMESHPHRSFSHAVIDVRGILVNAISIRFIAGRPKDHSLRENLRWGRYLLGVQKEESEFFTEYVSRLHGPVIFGGDLNAPPRSKTMRPVERIARDAMLEHNVWGGLTFRTEFPTLRIDYLFGMNGAESTAARRLDAVVSDHFPVYAEFRLRGPLSLAAGTAEK